MQRLGVLQILPMTAALDSEQSCLQWCSQRVLSWMCTAALSVKYLTAVRFQKGAL